MSELMIFNELRIFGRQVAYHHLLSIGVNYLVTVRRLTSNIVDGLPMAGHAGLEPATSCLTGKRSTN